MQIETTRIEIATEDGVSLTDATAEVSRFVRACGIMDGLCVLTVGRQECFLSLAPDLDAFDDLLRHVREAEPSLRNQAPRVPAVADRADTDMPGAVPPGIMAESLSFAVRGGTLELGSWDAVVLIDAHGPARRAIEVTIMGTPAGSTET